MNKYFSTTIAVALLSAMLVTFSGCNEQSNNDDKAEVVHIDSLLSGVTVNTIEELENVLMFSRELQKRNITSNRDFQENFSDTPIMRELQSSYKISDMDVSNILMSNLSEFHSYLMHTVEFDGFELFFISAGGESINYWYMPIGGDYKNFDHKIGIHIRFQSLENSDAPNIMAALAEQSGTQLTSDGFLYESHKHYNEFSMLIENTMIRIYVSFPTHLGDYEFIRDIALREFTPANIMSVDTMIERKAAERVDAEKNVEESITVASATDISDDKAVESDKRGK